MTINDEMISQSKSNKNNNKSSQYTFSTCTYACIYYGNIVK